MILRFLLIITLFTSKIAFAKIYDLDESLTPDMCIIEGGCVKLDDGEYFPLDELEDNFKENYSGNFKIGNPYRILGRKYRPKIDNDYEEVGYASWYGPKFHNKLTANGEIFNQYDITAAHPTLPLPSYVEVTNLENNKTIIVRLNDRGPFAKDRIIDLSYQSAVELGIISKGTAKVKVKFLKEESDNLHYKLFGQNFL